MDPTFKILLINGATLGVLWLFRKELFRKVANEAMARKRAKDKAPLDRVIDGELPPPDPAEEIAALKAEVAELRGARTLYATPPPAPPSDAATEIAAAAVRAAAARGTK